MKDTGLMHYFLGLEVWQKNGEIFLEQGIYAIESLKRFKMQDCRPMVTPMITNWKNVDASWDKEVDPTLLRHLTHVFAQHYARHFLPCQYPQPVHVGTEKGTLGSN